MKLVVLSFILLLQLTSEIMGYAIHSKRNEGNGFGLSLENGFNFDELGKELSNLGDDSEKALEALDLIVELAQQWFTAYKQRKLEPITSTIYKMIRTIIVKTNNEDIKKILKADESILKMLDGLNDEKDVVELFEQIGQNQELLVQGLEVFNAYLEVSELVKNDEVNEKIEKLIEDSLSNERSQELIQSVVQKFMELALILTEDTTVSQAKPAILEFSNYLIETIASGKLEPFLQALYDAAQLTADNIDMNDPKVHTFLNEVFKFEKILKESIKSVSQSKKRSFLIRQLLKLK